MKRIIILIICVLLYDFASCQPHDVCGGLNLRAPCDCHRPDRIMCRDRSVLYLDEVVWPEYVDVVEISLARNGIGSVDGGHAWPRTLQKLDLSRNRISSVSPSAFSRSCPDLEELNLAGNFLTRLDGEALAGLTKLKSLDLSRNNIEEFAAEWFKDTKSMVRVDLSDNSPGK